MHQYDIVGNPSGLTYRALLQASLPFCTSVTVAARPSLGLNATGRNVISQLAPFLTREYEASSWPGTRLLRGTATVYQFRLTGQVVDAMSQTSDSLFSWIQPDLPEDPCFLRASGEPWLVTISHEHDAYLDLTEDETNYVRANVPGLVLTPH